MVHILVNIRLLYAGVVVALLVLLLIASDMLILLYLCALPLEDPEAWRHNRGTV